MSKISKILGITICSSCPAYFEYNRYKYWKQSTCLNSSGAYYESMYMNILKFTDTQYYNRIQDIKNNRATKKNKNYNHPAYIANNIHRMTMHEIYDYGWSIENIYDLIPYLQSLEQLKYATLLFLNPKCMNKNIPGQENIETLFIKHHALTYNNAIKYENDEKIHIGDSYDTMMKKIKTNHIKQLYTGCDYNYVNEYYTYTIYKYLFDGIPLFNLTINTQNKIKDFKNSGKNSAYLEKYEGIYKFNNQIYISSKKLEYQYLSKQKYNINIYPKIYNEFYKWINNKYFFQCIAITKIEAIKDI